MYPAYNQEDPLKPKCAEDSAYPAARDSEYGWEKLFSERLCLAHRRNYGTQTYIAPVTLSDIMLVKPFRGALVGPSLWLIGDGTKILPGDRRYIRSAVSAQ